MIHGILTTVLGLVCCEIPRWEPTMASDRYVTIVGRLLILVGTAWTAVALWL